MRPLLVVVIQPLRHEEVEVPFVQNHKVVEAFLLDLLDEALDTGVGVRGRG
jgi:hypothetical protein